MISCHYYCPIIAIIIKCGRLQSMKVLLMVEKLVYENVVNYDTSMHKTKMGEQNWTSLYLHESKLHSTSILQLLTGYISIEVDLSDIEWTHFIPELSGHRSMQCYKIMTPLALDFLIKYENDWNEWNEVKIYRDKWWKLHRSIFIFK